MSSHDFLHPRLHVVEIRICLIHGNQLFVRSLFFNATFSQYNNPLRISNRRQTMGNDECGAVVRQLLQ